MNIIRYHIMQAYRLATKRKLKMGIPIEDARFLIHYLQKAEWSLSHCVILSVAERSRTRRATRSVGIYLKRSDICALLHIYSPFENFLQKISLVLLIFSKKCYIISALNQKNTQGDAENAYNRSF